MSDSSTPAAEALDAGRRRVAKAQDALGSARSHVADLEQRIAGGEELPHGDLADARAAVEFCDLALRGAHAPMQALQDAAAREVAEREVDRIAGTVRVLAGDVSRTLDAVTSALDDFAVACARYNQVVRAERVRVERCAPSARYSNERYQQPAVDGVPLGDVNGYAHLATALLPLAKDIGAQDFVVADLKQLAVTARSLPS